MRIPVEIVSLNQPWRPPALPVNEVVLRLFGQEATFEVNDETFEWLVRQVAQRMQQADAPISEIPSGEVPTGEPSPMATLREDLDPPDGPLVPMDPLEGLRARGAAVPGAAPAVRETPQPKPVAPSPPRSVKSPFENQGR